MLEQYRIKERKKGWKWAQTAYIDGGRSLRAEMSLASSCAPENVHRRCRGGKDASRPTDALDRLDRCPDPLPPPIGLPFSRPPPVSVLGPPRPGSPSAVEGSSSSSRKLAEAVLFSWPWRRNIISRAPGFTFSILGSRNLEECSEWAFISIAPSAPKYCAYSCHGHECPLLTCPHSAQTGATRRGLNENHATVVYLLRPIHASPVTA